MNKTWICLGATLLSLNLVGYTLPVPKGKTHEPRPAASSQVSPSRATLVKRVKAGLASLRTAPASYQAGIKEVPDYGINSETWQYDGDSAEGMVYFQFPGKYRIHWGPNQDIYCADGENIQVFNGGVRIRELKLSELPLWMLLHGEIDSTVKIDSLVEESSRVDGQRKPTLVVDLSPLGSGHGSEQIRLYFTTGEQPTLLGWRVPAERRSGWNNPNYIFFWLRDVHGEGLPADIFTAPQGT